MNAQVIALDSRRPVWRTVMGRCGCCHAEALLVQLASDPLDGIPCHECGAHALSVTHIRKGANFMPRPVVLQ